MSSLSALTIHELIDLLDRGVCSSEDVVTEVLSAIDARDERVGAYLDYDAEGALAAARSADDARSKGAERILPGIPIGIKDVLNVKGDTCRCGSRILEGYVSPYDATAVARLRQAGALFLGRLNMDEFAMGSTNENSAFQITHNPWNLEHVPGGSSGGSAAAVAAGEAVAALGTDTGGSIRQPASFCGCVGLKPTYGRVSRFGATAFASSLDQIGPITRCVRDAALLLGIMAGRDPLDSTTVEVPVPNYQEALADDLKGMKLGIPREYFVEGIDKEVEQSIRKAIRLCGDLGAEIVEISLPHTEYAVAVYYILATAEASANLARFDGVRYGARDEGHDPMDLYVKTRARYFGPEVKRRIILGTYVLSSGYYDAYYRRGQKVRTLIRRDFEQAFQECDAILAPVAPTTAYRLGEKIEDPLQMYLGDIFTIPASLAGMCGLSVPCGFSDAGLPIGLQIIGDAFREDRVLRVGYAYEQSTEWHKRIPPIRDDEGGR